MNMGMGMGMGAPSMPIQVRQAQPMGGYPAAPQGMMPGMYPQQGGYAAPGSMQMGGGYPQQQPQQFNQFGRPPF